MLTTSTAPKPLIDWVSIGKVLYISTASAVLLVVLFTITVYCLSTFRNRHTTVSNRVLLFAVALTSSTGILAVIISGLYYIINK